jgi:hypothetical protein
VRGTGTGRIPEEYRKNPEELDTDYTRQDQEDLDVPLKMQRLRQWCDDVNRAQTAVRYGFVYVDEDGFNKYKPVSFRQLVDGFTEYKEGIQP